MHEPVNRKEGPESERDYLTVAGLKALEKWQPRVHLSDWQIWIEIGTVTEENWAASSDKEWRMRRAHITLPPDYLKRVREHGEVPPGTSDDELVEHAVLHELLHIAEEPEGSHLNDELQWAAGGHSDHGVITSQLHTCWRDYREFWINQVVRMLIEADRRRWKLYNALEQLPVNDVPVVER